MPGIMERVRASWNVFKDGETVLPTQDTVTAFRESYLRAYRDSTSAVMAPIITRISIDSSEIPINHIDTDETGAFIGVRRFSELNQRLNFSANLDQTGKAFIQDAVVTMLEEGVCCIVPVKVTNSPTSSSSYDILEARVGVIKEWFNRSVRVSVYNEQIGDRQEITLPKTYVAIIQNPLYMVMNEPNSTSKRLIEKLALLDISDQKANAPNLDLILQLPYSTRNEKRLQEAQKSLALLEEQLSASRYGIAYIGSTEKITQLNRPVNNVMLEQVQYLTESLHAQLGLTPNIFSGSATPEENVNYHNRTVIPILNALSDGMAKAFLSKTALTQGQAIRPIPNIFRFEALSVISEAADKLTRNELASSNELRSFLGLPRSNDPEADELRNKNLNKPTDEEVSSPPSSPEEEEV